tara:strand:+ start:43 stop:570 length:528 start_codon:yes stop_codon:yes gene_type:complete
MSNTNSSLIAALDSTTGLNQFVAPRETGGRVRVASGNVNVVGTDFDANDDTIVLCRLPGNAQILSLQIGASDMDGGTDSSVNVGVYPAGVTAAASAVDEDCYVTASTDFRTITPVTEYRFETLLPVTITNRLWEDAGVASDPGPIQYDIVMTQVAASVSSPTTADVSFIIQYVID